MVANYESIKSLEEHGVRQTQGHVAPEGPRKRKSLGRRILRATSLLVLVVLITVLVLTPGRIPFLTLDEEDAIRFQRGERYALTRIGLPLPDAPDLSQLQERLAAKGLQEGSPLFVRIYKREFELELWMQRDGVFHHFTTYPICMWSGRLGPKLKQGDRQSPEGFYTVARGALNPNSSYHRSFNLGYPNAYDRAHGRTGSFLMVHGACASVGCFAMTDAQIDEIWRLVIAAFKGGQKQFQVQALPFRMTEQEIADHADHPSISFWKDLKAGSDLFDATRVPPRVSVCRGRYAVSPGSKGFDGGAAIASTCPANNS